MEALSYSLPSEAFFNIKKQLILARSTTKHHKVWLDFDEVIRTAFGLPSPAPPLTAFDKLLRDNSSSTDKLTARLAASVRARKAVPNSLHDPQPIEPTLDPAYIPSAIMALHLVGQECRLSLSGRQDSQRIAGLIRGLAAAIGRADWWDYWMRISPAEDVEPGPAREP